MSNLNVFNAKRRFDEDLGFNPNWNYGSPRKTAANYSIQRPRYGGWNTRSIGNAGYTFSLSFVDRPIEQVRYIRSFYEEYQYGFFTLIDHDNGGREHVGRFTSYSDDTETANLKYTIQVTFEDMPYAPMRNYPLDWANSSHNVNVADDLFKPLAAVGGTSWVLQESPVTRISGDPRAQEYFASVPAAGDFAQIEYVGWGCQTLLRIAPSLGICNILLDGVIAVTGLDLSNGTAASVDASRGTLLQVDEVLSLMNGSAVSVMIPSVPLGRHRFKIAATGAKNASATGTSVLFAGIRVIH